MMRLRMMGLVSMAALGTLVLSGCGSTVKLDETPVESRTPTAVNNSAGSGNTAIAEELALPPVKIHCSILAEDAIKAAVEDYKKKHNG